MKGKKKVRSRLAEAQEDLALVRLDRGYLLDHLDGYVLGVGAEWVLLAVYDGDVVLDGHAAVRVQDVKKVQRRNIGAMAQQALALRGQWPPAPPAALPDLDSTLGLAAALINEPALTVLSEHDEPDFAFVGAPVELDERNLRLLEVTPRGVWHSKASKHRLAGLTKVEFGNRYEQALLSVAGAQPAP